MIQAQDFLEPAVARGYDFWTGVPCSFLTPFINYVIDSPRTRYVGAASEGEAVAVALGAHLGGRKTVVICQNSGLGNAVNPLASLNHPFRVPTILVVTHRGAPGIPDEPQHALMGAITERMLEVLAIPWAVFPSRPEDVPAALARADETISASGLPFAMIMKKDSVAPYALRGGEAPPCPPADGSPRGRFEARRSGWMRRKEALRIVRDRVPAEAALIATTGKTGRELFELGHRPNQFYVIGGMGCASGIGLGVALARPARRIVVLDGDGAALMKMGTLGTIGHYRPGNLLHLLLDNEAHESTGAQATVSGSLDFARVASACGYAATYRCDTPEALEDCVDQALRQQGPTLVHVKIRVGSDPGLGRPTLSPVDAKAQFMRFLS